ncbi:MAG: hypothetical protein Q8R28_05860 [Dehalococcoidia bacterium]|nr:hypothetical protein [Dehalococcoidia bacterium]
MLEVNTLDGHEAWDRLRDLYEPSPIPPGHQNVLKNILDYVGPHCKTAVIESDYIDRDYRSSYSAFYSQLFSPPDFVCRRLHLFSSALDVPDPDPDQLHEFLESAAANGSYLGFVVMRPTESCRVGRTVIAPVMLKGNEYLTCRSLHEASLLGVRLRVWGAPFYEQDGYVARCAEVVVRSCVLHMQKSQGLREYSIPTIHQVLSDKSHDRQALPSEGLSPAQMSEAFKSMGYNPIRFDKKTISPWRPCELLYPYLESGIPVIVFGTWGSQELHTELVVGHSSDYRRLLKPKKARNTHPSAGAIKILPTTMEWVTGLLINDDSRGPYIPHGVNDAEVKGIEKILIPLPPKIHLRPDHIVGYVSRLLDPQGKGIAYLRMRAGAGSLLSGFLDVLGDLVLHVFFCRSNDLKMSMRYRHHAPVAQVSTYVRLVNMPRYVWVAEVTTHAYWRDQEKRVIGQFVFDSTASSFENALLLQHVPGYLQASEYRNPEQRVGEMLTEDHEYSPYFSSRSSLPVAVDPP